MATTTVLPRQIRGGPGLAVVLAGAVVLGTLVWGVVLRARGADLHDAGGAPLTGAIEPRVTLALLLPVAVGAAAVAYGPRLAARLPWPVLLTLSAATMAGWAVALALVDGLPALSAPLTSPHEYLTDVPRVGDVAATLATWTDHVRLDSPGFNWTTHVAGHPPGALLSFVLLDRIGLAGAGAAAAVCIAAGASAVPAVLSTVRRLGGEAVARRSAPYVAVAPLALWVATSADALFAGVAAWGVAAFAGAAARRGPVSVLLGLLAGLLLAAALLLSYGLLLLAVPVVAVAVALRAARLLVPVGGVVVTVLAGLAGLGFSYLDGLVASAARVREGAAWPDRPAVYFAVAGVAATAVAIGPAAVGGLSVLHRGPLGRAAVLPVAALAALSTAVASTLARGELERIGLPFAVALLPAAAALPGSPRRWLAAQVAVAVTVQACWRLGW